VLPALPAASCKCSTGNVDTFVHQVPGRNRGIYAIFPTSEEHPLAPHVDSHTFEAQMVTYLGKVESHSGGFVSLLSLLCAVCARVRARAYCRRTSLRLLPRMHLTGSHCDLAVMADCLAG
jgi:hypothetical protein